MRAVGTPSPSHTSCPGFLTHVFRNSGQHRSRVSEQSHPTISPVCFLLSPSGRSLNQLKIPKGGCPRKANLQCTWEGAL